MSDSPSSSMIILGLKLALIAGIAAVVLAVADALTQAPRAAAQRAVIEKTMKAILPPYDRAGAPVWALIQSDTVWIGSENESAEAVKTAQKIFKFRPVYQTVNGADSLIGYAAEGESLKGYGGRLAVMFGLESDGTVGIVNVIASNETPGLGTVETERKKQKTLFNFFESDDDGLPPNAYLDQFRGMSAGSDGPTWKVEADGGTLNAKTGATITMRAVAEAVRETVDCFMNHRNAIHAVTQKELAK